MTSERSDCSNCGGLLETDDPSLMCDCCPSCDGQGSDDPPGSCGGGCDFCPPSRPCRACGGTGKLVRFERLGLLRNTGTDFLDRIENQLRASPSEGGTGVKGTR